MFKVKKSGWVLTLVVVVALCAYGDFELSRGAEEEVRASLSTHDIAGGFSDRLRVGMERSAAEDLIAGFRSTELFEADGQLTVIYSYWYGFLPPLPGPLRYKVRAKVSVTYGADSTVTAFRSWHS